VADEHGSTKERLDRELIELRVALRGLHKRR
jgi:hypothetical protein